METGEYSARLGQDAEKIFGVTARALMACRMCTVGRTSVTSHRWHLHSCRGSVGATQISPRFPELQRHLSRWRSTQVTRIGRHPAWPTNCVG